MNCIHCHGQMKRSNAPFHVDRKGYHLMFDTVPAWVCEQCGEAYFEEREVTTIQSAIKGLDQQARQLVGAYECNRKAQSLRIRKRPERYTTIMGGVQFHAETE